MENSFEVIGFEKIETTSMKFKDLTINDPSFRQYGEWHSSVKGNRPTIDQMFWLESILVDGNPDELTKKERTELINLVLTVINVGCWKTLDIINNPDDQETPISKNGNAKTKLKMNYPYFITKVMVNFGLTYDEVMDASFFKYQTLLNNLETINMEQDLRNYHIAKTPAVLSSKDGLKSFKETTNKMAKEIEKRTVRTIVVEADLGSLYSHFGGE